jgi:Family of unknown function (DUF6350)
MSIAVDRSGRAAAPGPRPGPGSGAGQPPRRSGRSQIAAGALAAAQAATASLVVILVPVVLAWATASYSQAPWGQAVQLGVAVWLLAHHTGIAIPAGRVGLMPLGATMIPLLTCWFAGVRLARTLDPNADAIRAGVGRSRPVRPPARAMLALVFGYAAVVTLVGVMATTAAVRPTVLQAFVGAALICGLGSTAGAAAWVAGGVLPGVRRVIGWLNLPEPVRRCLRPAAIAVVVPLVGAVLIFGLALVLGWHRVTLLHQGLAPGVVGGLVLTIGQLAVVPNLIVWAGAYAAGPGFAVGTGTSVMPGHLQLGALPAVPVLGALPVPGEVPNWAWALLALPVLAGVLAGGWIIRAGAGAGSTRSVPSVLQDAGLTALLAGAGWALLGWLSGGPAGPGRLAQFGPNWWQLGLAIGAEVALGALFAVGVGLAVRYLAATDPAEPEPNTILDLT